MKNCSFGRGNEFCLLNMTGRKLNGSREKYGVVDLPPPFQAKLQKILLSRDDLNSHLGMASEEMCNLRLRRKIDAFYDLVLLVMRHNLPQFRFKLLIDQKLPFELLVKLFEDTNMDSRLEIIQIYFLDEVAQASGLSVLNDITFKTGNEVVLRPFENLWRSI
ncbi:MAG: hypothetical protein WCX30_02165 [Candidatus Paceibacterota bacterium]|jgi:hypothetical protein|nr:hypothetical protein [bacterium]